MDLEPSPNPEDIAIGNTPEKKLPQSEIEKKAFDIYDSYFGSNWQELLDKTLFITVRSATADDRKNAGPNLGWVSTQEEVTMADNRILRNHIIIFNPEGATNFPLRTEIGEALWNMLENAAVTEKLPENKQGVATGFQNLVTETVPPQAVVNFSGEILDKWNQVYTHRPNRYAGMNPNAQREYHRIPEW